MTVTAPRLTASDTPSQIDPQEGEAGELVGAEERVAEHLAGEDVADHASDRQGDADDGADRAMPTAACE